MAFPTKEKKKRTGHVCQDCVELFEPTAIYVVRVTDHSILLCEACVKERGTTGKLFKEPKTRKPKA